MATTTIHTLAYKIVADTREFSKGVTATRKELSAARKIFDETRTPAEKLGDTQKGLAILFRKGAIDAQTYRRALASLKTEKSTLAAVGTRLSTGIKGIAAGMLAGVTAAMSFRAMLSGIISDANRIDAMSKLSRRSGISMEDLSAFEVGAQLGGVEFSSLSSTLADYAKNLGQASRGMGRAQQGFAALGLSAKKLIDMPLVDSLGLIADRLNRLDEADRIGLASKIFGESGGKEFLSFLEGGSAGLRAMREEAERLGAVLDSRTGKSTEDINDAFTRLGIAARSKRQQILAPVAASAATNINRFLAVKDAKVMSRKEMDEFLRQRPWTLYFPGVGKHIVTPPKMGLGAHGAAIGPGLSGFASGITSGLGAAGPAIADAATAIGKAAAEALTSKEAQRAMTIGYGIHMRGVGQTLFRGFIREPLREGLSAMASPMRGKGDSSVIERNSREFFDLLASRQREDVAKQQLDVLKGILRAVGLGDVVNLVPVEAV